jgi:hypothetical protein
MKKLLVIILLFLIGILNIEADELEICMEFIKNELTFSWYYLDGKDELKNILIKNNKFKQMFDNQKDNFEPIVANELKQYNLVYIYLADYYKYLTSVEYLVDIFVKDFGMYSWEGPDYEKIDAYIFDAQYPISCLCIEIIEDIMNTEIENIRVLTGTQYNKLYEIYAQNLPLNKEDNIKAFSISDSLKAYWKLKKLGYNIKLYK